MFHPGKVLAVFRNDDKTVFSADKSVQAMVSMWDDNLITAEVEPVLSDKIREGDVVLLDYSPKYQTIPVPKQIVSKILRGEAAKKLWTVYSEKVQKKKTDELDLDRVPEGNFHIR